MSIKEQGTLESKTEHALDLIKDVVKENPKVIVACSLGKDSMVITDLARKVDPNIPIFYTWVPFKPKESLTYLKDLEDQFNLDITLHCAVKEIPDELKFLGKDKVICYPDLAKRAEGYKKELNLAIEKEFGKQEKEFQLYDLVPSACCDVFKTDVTKKAVRNYDAWISGLRRDEGRTRKGYKYVEIEESGLIKLNPIIDFTEEDVFNYLENNNIPVHPWYLKEFEDDRRYRSIGCEPCTIPIYSNQPERAGRWNGKSKCGGECGIHTQPLK